ncbi:hypothetical protein C8Q70DRAFT_937221 [Cubamyces menziesii]|nr:hypothetical protein C8Q70DRAFT_937221 [Cubamyces menziesii]
MSQPPAVPPKTPGPMRIHRPREGARFVPYQIPTARSPESHSQGDENFNPTGIHTPLHAPGAATPLRRHVSATALLESSGRTENIELAPYTAYDSSVLIAQTNATQLTKTFEIEQYKNELEDYLRDPSCRDILLYCQILKIRTELQAHSNVITDMKAELNSLKAYVVNNWVLSQAQLDHLTGLLGHWLIKPVATYEKLFLRVQDFVHIRAEWLHLGVYLIDPLARQTIDKFLQTQMGQLKGTYRKEVISSLKSKKQLEDFGRAMLQKYHAPIVPGTPSQSTLAALALLRAVAAGDIKMPKGSHDEGGTGSSVQDRYWPTVEAELTRLYKIHGSDRQNDAWKEWEVAIITADNSKYAPSRFEDLTARLPSDDGDPVAVAGPLATDEPAGEGPALPVNIPPEAMNGDIDINHLGDVGGRLDAMLLY